MRYMALALRRGRRRDIHDGLFAAALAVDRQLLGFGIRKQPQQLALAADRT